MLHLLFIYISYIISHLCLLLSLYFQGQLSQALNVLSDRATEAKEFLVQLRNMVQHIQVQQRRTLTLIHLYTHLPCTCNMI